MNVSLAVYAKDDHAGDAVRRRFAAATAYIESAFPDAKTTARNLATQRYSLYNTDRLAGSWSVPVWIEDGPVTASFSAPPVPRRDRITAATYTDRVLGVLGESDGLGAFNPCYFGAVVDADADRLVVWSDLIGLGRCYWVETDRWFAASNHLGALTFFLDGQVEVDAEAWQRFASFGWFVGDRTPFAGITRLPAATVVVCAGGRVARDTYADEAGLVAPRQGGRDFAGTEAELRTIAANAAAMMNGTPTVWLSGGKDSRLAAAAWLAAGAPASIVTYGTVGLEAEGATRLVAKLAQSTDLRACGVTHTVEDENPARDAEALTARIDGCMRLYDGDHPPVRMAAPVDLVPPVSIAVGGGGGEIAHGIYYQTRKALDKIAAMPRPIERAIAYYSNTALPATGRRLVADHLHVIEAEGTQPGIAGPSILDYLFLREWFRRRTPGGHTTSDLILCASPAFVRLAFDITPDERLAGHAHRLLTDAMVPGWGDVPYFSSEPLGDDQRAHRGMRMWQGGTRNLLFDTVADGTAYRAYWDREGVLEVALRVCRGRTDRRDEALFQRVLWVERFAAHAKALAARVARGR